MLKVEELISTAEMAQVQADTIKALERGKNALQEIQKELSLEYAGK